MASIIVPNGIGSKSTSIGQRIGFTKIRYFEETDTLLIDFREAPVVKTRDLDENTILDVDKDGKIRSITMEHASTRAGISQFSYEKVPPSRLRRPMAAICAAPTSAGDLIGWSR